VLAKTSAFGCEIESLQRAGHGLLMETPEAGYLGGGSHSWRGQYSGGVQHARTQPQRQRSAPC
jgi:hypothetical protein